MDCAGFFIYWICIDLPVRKCLFKVIFEVTEQQ